MISRVFIIQLLSLLLSVDVGDDTGVYPVALPAPVTEAASTAGQVIYLCFWSRVVVALA